MLKVILFCITLNLESRDFLILTWKNTTELAENADLAKMGKHDINFQANKMHQSIKAGDNKSGLANVCRGRSVKH